MLVEIAGTTRRKRPWKMTSPTKEGAKIKAPPQKEQIMLRILIIILLLLT